MTLELIIAGVLLLAWLALLVGAGITAPAVHLLLAAAAILFVHGWALTR